MQQQMPVVLNSKFRFNVLICAYRLTCLLLNLMELQRRKTILMLVLTRLVIRQWLNGLWVSSINE